MKLLIWQVDRKVVNVKRALDMSGFFNWPGLYELHDMNHKIDLFFKVWNKIINSFVCHISTNLSDNVINTWKCTTCWLLCYRIIRREAGFVTLKWIISFDCSEARDCPSLCPCSHGISDRDMSKKYLFNIILYLNNGTNVAKTSLLEVL